MVEFAEVFKLILTVLGDSKAYISIVLIFFHVVLSWISKFSQRIAAEHIANACRRFVTLVGCDV